MRLSLIAMACGLVALGGSTSAQQPSAHLDLDVITPDLLLHRRSPSFVAANVAFADANVRCPEEHGTLRISRGEVRLYRLDLVGQEQPSSRANKPLDDETWEYWIGTKQCMLNMAVRLQTRSGGAWGSVPLPALSRPNLSAAERREIMGALRQRPRANPPSDNRAQDNQISSERMDRWLDSARSFESLLGEENNIFSAAFFFGEGPRDCVDALGTYQIGPNAVTFSFVTGLPGPMNHFAIERADADAYRSRLYFVREDCRVQITISAWAWYHYDWAPQRLLVLPSRGTPR